jgi:hypothetical protein
MREGLPELSVGDDPHQVLLDARGDLPAGQRDPDRQGVQAAAAAEQELAQTGPQHGLE